MKNVLITGGLGFLGSHSIEKFKAEGWNVTVVDNLSSSVITPDDPICKDVNVVICDLLDYNWGSTQFNLILHYASPVGPVGVLKHSGQMANMILEDTYRVILGAKINRNCPLIFVSTSEIYGYRDHAIMLKENDDKVLVGEFSVRNEYAQAKLLAEIVLCNTAKTSNLKYQIVRPFNISGARQLKAGGFVLPTFVTQALEGKDITVFGNGEQVRAFTHVKDIVDGIYLVSTMNKYNQIWNIGNSHNISTINYIANCVKEVTKSKSKIIHVDPKTIHGPLFEETWDKVPNSEKISSELEWCPIYDREYIIHDVINFYRSKYNGK